MFFFGRHHYLTLTFIIRHPARITECTLHNNDGKDNWNIEGRKIESIGRWYTLVMMWPVIVAAALVFEPRPIAMFLSLFIGCHYKPIMRLMNFSSFFCMILLSSISSSDLNGSVIDCAGDRNDGSLI